MFKHFREFLSAVRRGDYRLTPEGLLLKGSVLARGTYDVWVDGDLVEVSHNLVPTEGLAYFLDTGLLQGAAAANFYMAIFSGAVSPAANWTAANFAANASEITSATEGYSNPTRPEWVPGAIVGSRVDNLASRATFNIVCTTSIDIAGAAVLSDSAKGGTSGTLISATRYGSPHTVNNGSTFELGYAIELLDS